MHLWDRRTEKCPSPRYLGNNGLPVSLETSAPSARLIRVFIDRILSAIDVEIAKVAAGEATALQYFGYAYYGLANVGGRID